MMLPEACGAASCCRQHQAGGGGGLLMEAAASAQVTAFQGLAQLWNAWRNTEPHNCCLCLLLSLFPPLSVSDGGQPRARLFMLFVFFSKNKSFIR